ncbi:DUF6461 domain-containing protein [Streptomyces sp. NPDC056638]|uniref:DUF6461 domain-containing protein n=1 Tax=Streptomyces sp. NPDC056638 TaxID=3345887 RepID=UPI0036A87BD1
MSDGLAWIADAWRSATLNAGDLYFTCARGLTPEQLAERMADHEPVEIGPALTMHEVSRMVDLTQIYCVGRVGRSDDWSFIVECGGSEGWALDPAVSRGAEVLILDPRPDDPPSFFTYLADGEVQLHFELGFGYDPAGAQPTYCTRRWKRSDSSHRKTPSTTCSATTMSCRPANRNAGY